MKRTALVLGIGLSLLAKPVDVKAHGGCFGFWPLWPLAFGAGVALSSAAYYDSYSYPRYVYAPPAYPYYTYNYPATSSVAVPPPQALPSSPQLNPPPAPAWVPSYPGAGHWIPDPQPYSYTPQPARHQASAAQSHSGEKVTITRGAGGIPVYTVGQP
ncbi:MAG TPA: hypothetical protein VHI52_20435 [Verrucomicrobiae bacterium]|nr:hypothetical protein [Verrucomicrobiae bacterium]